MLWNNLPYEEALAIYEMKLKEILRLNEDSVVKNRLSTDDKLDSLIDGLANVNTVNQIRNVATSLKGENE